MIALVAAIQEELKDVAKDMTAVRLASSPARQLLEGDYCGKPVLLVQTGMGKDCAQQATRYVLENYPVKALISFGFGGGLVSGLGIGDLVLCSQVYVEGQAQAQSSYASDPNQVDLAMRVLQGSALSPLTGSLLTVDRPQLKSEQKQALGQVYQAQVVDMETYWVAGLAIGRKVPFLAVRAISDTLGERLPAFDRFIDPEGRPLRGEAFRYFLKSPWDLGLFPKLALHAQKARKNLTGFLQIFVRKLDCEA